MPSNTSDAAERDDLRKLIEEIQQRISAAGKRRNREYELQCEAFNERCEQARELASRSRNPATVPAHDDGDAYRVQQALRLSLEFFRREAPAPE